MAGKTETAKGRSEAGCLGLNRAGSWNEIRDRALAFSKEYADESSEDAEAKSFWDG